MTAIETIALRANGLNFTADVAGSGDDVALCLHGFPECRFSWRYQLPLLAEMGWKAIAPDLRGYGDSDVPPRREDYHIDHLIEDVAGLFEAAGARRRLLIGHDWGAGIAWAFALEKRLPLDGLIIMNVPHPTVLGRVMRSSWRQPLRSWYMGFFQIPGLPEAMLTANGARAIGRTFSGMAIDKSRFPPDVTDVYRRNALRPGGMTAMVNYYRANTQLMGRWDPPPLIETPTLMVWGEEDKALGIENTRGYEGLVKDFTLKTLPRVSHWVQQEAPEAVNAIMRTWLDDRIPHPTAAA